MIRVQAPQYRQFALISDFLDLAHLSTRAEAALATIWIQDRPEGLKLQNLALGTMTGPVLSSVPKTVMADVQYAIDKSESLGSGQQLILHGNPSVLAGDFFPAYGSHFMPKMHFQYCMILQGTLGGNFGIFAARGESTAWMLLWKTRSRPIGVFVLTCSTIHLFQYHI